MREFKIGDTVKVKGLCETRIRYGVDEAMYDLVGEFYTIEGLDEYGDVDINGWMFSKEDLELVEAELDYKKEYEKLRLELGETTAKLSIALEIIDKLGMLLNTH